MAISFFVLVELFKANLAGIIAASVFSPLAIWMTRRAGLLDIPGTEGHKQHEQATPLAGGVVLMLVSAVLVTIFHLWSGPYTGVMIAAAIIFIFGLWDDAKGLSVWQKFAGQGLATIVLIASGTSVQFLVGLKITFLPPTVITVLQWAITVFWVIGITNSINLVDSMDGLASGIAGIAFVFFMGMALVAQQSALALYSAIFLGICIGLFVFNIRPARLFLGDSGAQMLGFILAAVGIIYKPYNLPQGSSWFVPIMVLGMPIFDTILVIVSRLRRHKSIFQADRAHTYHRLIALGLDPNRAILVIHMITLGLNFLAFIALSLSPLTATLLFSLSMLICVVLVILLEFNHSIVLTV